MSTQSSSPSPPPPDSPSNSHPQNTPPLTDTITVTTTPKPPIVKKPQPIPWTHQETIHLIQTYQEKWYSLKRGQLKASQWEEVAVTVAARCGYDDFAHTAKTATQCRHKMEKLRKRLRAEKQRLGSSASSSPWPYYHLMEALQRGPFPISSRPPTMQTTTENGYTSNNNHDDDVEDEEDEDEGDKRYSKSQSISYILRRPSLVNRFVGIGRSGGFSEFIPEPVQKKRRIEVEEKEEMRGRRSDGRIGLKLAEEIKGFAKRVMEIEKKKMEFTREIENFKMEMQNKRIEMIVKSQKKLVDVIKKTFGSIPDNLKLEQEV